MNRSYLANQRYRRYFKFIKGSAGFYWPAIDLIYYKITGNVLKFFRQFNRPSDTNLIFPLVYRPFNIYWFPSPIRPVDYMKRHITLTECASREYSHLMERSMRAQYVDCNTLRPWYAFVRHGGDCSWNITTGTSTRREHGIREDLIGTDGVVIHSLCFSVDVGSCDC